ncbi:hypothetical protein C8J57DRAFT_1233312 [Mycena rebaudengoi]|nr:hypothetical protein C8J57DRAFT_1233312 [Mycena rebaudengoi]
MEARQAKKAWGRARIARGVGPRGRRRKKGGRLRQQRQGSPWGCDWFCSRMALMILSRPSSVMMMKGEAEGVAAGAAWAFVGPAIGAVKGAGAAGEGSKEKGGQGNPAEEGLGANREEEEEALGKEEAAVGKKGEAVVCGRDPLRLTGGRAEGGVGMKGGRREEGPATGGTGGGFSGRAGDPRGSAPPRLGGGRGPGTSERRAVERETASPCRAQLLYVDVGEVGAGRGHGFGLASIITAAPLGLGRGRGSFGRRGRRRWFTWAAGCAGSEAQGRQWRKAARSRRRSWAQGLPCRRRNRNWGREHRRRPRGAQEKGEQGRGSYDET